jgi:hypothetical protein|eukprot:COSAG02_NODE_65_length_42645_cov_26.951934_34_plen_173_part_00
MESPLKIREELMSAASPAAQKEYIEGLRKYFRGLLSHRELALIVRSALGPHTAIHNRFIRAIFTSAEHKALLEEYGPTYIKDKTKPEGPRPAPQPAAQKKTGAPPSQPVVRVPYPTPQLSVLNWCCGQPHCSVPLSACWLACAGRAYTQAGENNVEWCVRDALQPRAQRFVV